jgi:hypothetical protein
VSFSHFVHWRAFALDIGLRNIVLEVVAPKFERTQKVVSWLGLTSIFLQWRAAALELALRERYGAKVKRRKRKLRIFELTGLSPPFEIAAASEGWR